ncbi:hypothetical protein [Streptomyces rubrogriseus]|uniref:Uncharacterized protein n=1 Tax=Streptomyces rubrogriseus TaxID=194673 RepID=A0A6G3TCT2_9ACTN|nr:hypothetical protein [Streptomyces rubrogriseus]NEC33831.1 hypothetical protein [Streptomyces rubrogriseus]
MSNPSSPEQPTSPTAPQVMPTRARSGYGLVATAILCAGIGGGLLSWHPWDKVDIPKVPTKNPQHITIQKVGYQSDPSTDDDKRRPVYCMTNETGAMYCMVMPDRYTGIQEDEQ